LKGGRIEMNEFINKEGIYEILMQHQFNENRIIAERTSLFLLSNSVLLISFAMLVPISQMICTVIPIVAMVFCFITWVALKAAQQSLEFSIEGQRRIEEQEGGCFDYMREQRLSPHLHGWSGKGITKLWRLFPLTAWLFFAIWIAGLVYVWFTPSISPAPHPVPGG